MTAGTPLVRLEAQTFRAELDRAKAALALSTENFRRTRIALAPWCHRGPGAGRGARGAGDRAGRGRSRPFPCRSRHDQRPVRRRHRPEGGQRRPLCRARRRAGGAGADRPAQSRFPPVGALADQAEARRRRRRDCRRDPGRQFEGRIVALDPQVDVNGRAVQLRATVPNADRVLRPGLFARVTLELDQRPDAVLVPEAAIVLQEAGPLLYKVEDGKAVATKITTGVRRDGMVEITEGVAAGADGDRQWACPPARPAEGRDRSAAKAGLSPHEPARDLHPPAGVRDRPQPAAGAGRPRVLRPAAGARIPEHRRAGGLGDRPTYPGASAEIIETQVTQVLEDSLAGIEGIDVLTSISRSESQPDHGALHARPRSRRCRGRRARPGRRACAAGCRDEIDEPIIAKVEADAHPIIYLAFSSDRHLVARDHRLRRPLSSSDRLQNLPGVAEVQILRRAPLCHAHLARPRPARRLRPDAAGRRGRAPAPERRGPVRPHREPAARVHRPVPRPT